jgi:hypothetical protein
MLKIVILYHFLSSLAQYKLPNKRKVSTLRATSQNSGNTDAAMKEATSSFRTSLSITANTSVMK